MFDVEWEPTATEQFAAISVLHRSQWKDIDAAENSIDKKRRENPLTHSQPVAEGLRRITSHPLLVYFSIEGSLVVVESVRWIEF